MYDKIARRLLPIHQVLLIPVGLLLIYELVTFGQEIRLSQQRRQELQQIEQKITLAQQDQARLDQLHSYAQSDAAAEEWARENGMAMTGEVPVILLAPSVEPTQQSNQEPPSTGPDMPRDQWWDLLFGLH
jgi:hypothetical protein